MTTNINAMIYNVDTNKKVDIECNLDSLDEEFYQAEEAFYYGKYGDDFHILYVSGISGKLFGDEKPYPEHVAKYNSLGGKLGEIVGWLNEHGHDKEAQGIAVCGGQTNAVDLRCHAEHRYAKQIFCGRQYCPRCGEVESVIHQRRYSRSWDRLMWAPALGKVVLTVPEELRNDFKDIDMLGKLHKFGWECVKETLGRELNIDGAMTTVHFFGDKDKNEGKDIDKFHPHVNITFPLCSDEALVVSEETLKALRNKWYDMLEELTGKKISLTEDGRERKNAHYGFKVSDAQKAQWVKYVLRPTVGAERFLRLDDDLKEFIVTLVGFHNVRWYGKLSNRNFKGYREDYLENAPFYQEFIAKKQEQESEKPDFKYCPICHGRLKVHKHKGKVEILEKLHESWHELSKGFWCDEPTWKILVRKGLVGADGKFIGASP
jgi:hypothetical protein